MGPIELKVGLHCEGCERKIRKALFAMPGVHSVEVDSRLQKITVHGNVEPRKLLKKLKNIGKSAEFWTAHHYTLATQANSNSPCYYNSYPGHSSCHGSEYGSDHDHDHDHCSTYYNPDHAYSTSHHNNDYGSVYKLSKLGSNDYSGYQGGSDYNRGYPSSYSTYGTRYEPSIHSPYGSNSSSYSSYGSRYEPSIHSPYGSNSSSHSSYGSRYEPSIHSPYGSRQYDRYYDRTYPSSPLVRYAPDYHGTHAYEQQKYISSSVDDPMHNMFSDENANACSIM